MDMIVSDEQMLRDLHLPVVLGKNGKPRRRYLVGLPGGKAGVRCAGVVHAFQDAGIPAEHFDTLLGTSASSFNFAAYRKGKAHLIRREYEHLCDVPFLFPQWDLTADWWTNMFNFHHVLIEDWMNLRYLVNRLRVMGLDEKPKTKTRLMVGVSELNGKLKLLDADAGSSVLESCEASASVYPATRGVVINDIRYIDGGHAHPCPVAEIVRKERSQGHDIDILVVANRAHPRHISFQEWAAFQFMVHTMLPWFSWSLCASTRLMDHKVVRVAEMAKKPRKHIRIAVWFARPDKEIQSHEWRKSVVRDAGQSGYDGAREVLERFRP